MNIQNFIDSVYASSESQDSSLTEHNTSGTLLIDQSPIEKSSEESLSETESNSLKDIAVNDSISNGNLYDFSSLKFRIIGYYNQDSQFMNEEDEYPDKAAELAALLKTSFAKVNDLPKNKETKEFIDAFNGRAVIIFRDTKYHLYAYWPLKNMARITNVTYVQSTIISIPFYLKNWFVPGEPFSTIKISMEQLSFFDYIKNNINKDEKVSLRIMGKDTVKGIITNIGQDFLVLSSSDRKEYVISNNIVVIRGSNISETQFVDDSQIQEEENCLQANGYICNINKDGGRIFVYSTQRQIRFSKFFNQHIENLNLKVNDKVIFQYSYNKTGKEYAMSLCPINFEDASRVAATCLASEDVRLKRTGQFIRARLKEENGNIVLNAEDSRFEVLRNEVNQLIIAYKYKEAEKKYIEEFEKSNDIRIVKELVSLYQRIYSDANSSERDEISRNVLNFINKNDKLLSNENIGLRKSLLVSIERADEFVKYIDKQLRFCESNRIMAILLKHKALLVGDDKNSYREFLSESLAFNPWDKAAEKLLNDELGFDSDEYRTQSFAVSMDEESIYSDSFLSNLFIGYVPYDSKLTQAQKTELAQSSKKELDSQQDLSRYNTSDYNNCTLKLIHCYKSLNASALPGKLLSSYCSSRALAMAKENGDLQSIRFLIQKSLTYVGGLGYFVRRNLYIYILSLTKLSGVELYASLPTPTEIQDFTKILLSLVKNHKNVWVDEISMILSANNAVEKYITEKCFECEEIRISAQDFFNKKYNSGSLDDYKSFLQLWMRHKELCHNNLEKESSAFYISNDNYEVAKCIASLRKYCCISDIEKELIQKVIELMVESSKLSSIDDVTTRQRSSIELTKQCDILSNEIFNNPTRVLCILNNSITNISNHIHQLYKQTLNSYNNKVSISPLCPNVAIFKKNNRYYTIISLEILKEEGGLSIRDLSISILKKNDEVPPIEQQFSGSLSSGNSWECKAEISLSQSDLRNKYVEFIVMMKYFSDSDGKKHQVQKNFKINLYSQSDFVPIENKYTSGKALQGNNEEMFYGRTELMQQLESTFRTEGAVPHFIIYGQKRCGKTSFRNILACHLADCEDLVVVSFELPDEISDEYDFYRVILNSIANKVSNDVSNLIQLDELEHLRQSMTSVEFFKKQFIKLKQIATWGKRRLLLLIDEFTRICDGIKEGTVKQTILKDWKMIAEDPDTQFGAVLFGHDITPIFLAEDYNKNAKAILSPKRMNYLTPAEARDLIIKPVLDNGRSRYVGKSVKRIMEYTARSPYYIQIFCKELIDYMNRQYSYRITLTDVETVAEMLYRNTEDNMTHSFRTIDSFDNLISNGRHSTWNDYKDEEIVNVLRIIAEKSDESGMCSRESIHLNPEDYLDLSDSEIEEKEDGILNDLSLRDVIKEHSIDGVMYYQIRVLLFKEWLINHPE